MATIGQQQPHPNLPWFYQQMESKLAHMTELNQRPTNAAPGMGAYKAMQFKGEKTVGLLHEMDSVGCTPPRRMLVRSISTLAAHPTSFESAVEAFWFMEMRTPHNPCSTVVRALVAGTLEAAAMHSPGSAMWTAGNWRALGILENLTTSAELYPSRVTVTNKVLWRCAMSSRTVPQLQRVEAAIQTASKAHVSILDKTFSALLSAWERLGDRQRCLDILVKMREQSWSPDPETLLSLHQWSLEEGDVDAAHLIEAELVDSGKAAYLAALSSPRC